MKFEWDEEKNKTNLEKHGIDFKDAVKIFFDKNRVTFFDDREDYFETREITIGNIGDCVLISVVHTDRNDTIRVISARKASKRERGIYYG